MAGNELIPALDPMPVPGPLWLYHVLWVVTFLIHILLVNAVLGGSVIAAWAGTARADRRRTVELLLRVNTWAIPLSITFGIAPLLFVQVVLGRFFYTAALLVPWWWLGLLGLLMVGYYLNYLAKWRLARGEGVRPWLVLQAVCFLLVTLIQVVVNLLHMQPQRWEAAAGGLAGALADPTLIPRFLHFLLAALAMVGAMVAWVAVRQAARGVAAGERQELEGMAHFGVKFALYATLLQLIDGFWLLFALPEEVLKGFMRSGPAAMIPLTLGILAGVLLLVFLAQVHDPLAQGGKVRRALELVVAATAVMVITRHQVREVYLAPARAAEELITTAPWGLIALFLVIFVAGVATTVYAMVRAATDRPAPGEQAA
ncbi:MAG: hypothetical protein HRF46_14880 [Acidobacteriota bacterium]|jgi:hypothetical protein